MNKFNKLTLGTVISVLFDIVHAQVLLIVVVITCWIVWGKVFSQFLSLFFKGVK